MAYSSLMTGSLKELMSLSLGIYSLINLFNCLTFFLSFTPDINFQVFQQNFVNILKIFLHHFLTGR